jgi:hypothetical protein
LFLRSTYLSKEYLASILRVKEKLKQEISVKQAASKLVPPKRQLYFAGLHGVVT